MQHIYASGNMIAEHFRHCLDDTEHFKTFCPSDFKRIFSKFFNTKHERIHMKMVNFNCNPSEVIQCKSVFSFRTCVLF